MSKLQYSKLLLAVPILLASGRAYAGAVVLNPAAASVTVTYTLPSTAGALQTVNFTPTNISTFVYAESSTLPSWLNVSVSGSGVGGGTVAIPFNFQANAVAGTYEPGNYTSNVTFATTASGYSPATVTIAVTLVVKSAAPKFGCSATSGGSSTTGSLSYAYGSGNPLSMAVTCTSTGEEIAFAVGTTSNPVGLMSLNSSNGIAYAWGSAAIQVTFSQQLLLQASPGTAMTGAITVTPASCQRSTPGDDKHQHQHQYGRANLHWCKSQELPLDTTTDHTVVLSGSGFLTGVTQVFVTNGNTTYNTSTPLDAAHYVVASPTSIIVTLDHNTYLSATHALTSAGSIKFEVANGSASPGTTSPATAAYVEVTTAPIIYAVTNAASYVQTPGTNPQISPYEIISIFGANFDAGQGLASNPSVQTAPYVFSPVMNNSAGKGIKVEFFAGGTISSEGTSQGKAALIFVSNNQINAIVPAGIGTALSLPAAGGVNILVSVNAGSLSSSTWTTNDALFLLDVYAATPGIFTPSGSGQGIAAVLNAPVCTTVSGVTTCAPSVLNSQGTPALHGTTITIFATGLGAPDATEVAYTPPIAGAYPANCIGVDATGYLGVLNTTLDLPTGQYSTTQTAAVGGWTAINTIDGAVMSSLYMFANMSAPCFAPTDVTVTLTNGTGTPVILTGTATPASSPVEYAGFVADSIAGLDQINVALPRCNGAATGGCRQSGNADTYTNGRQQSKPKRSRRLDSIRT